MSYRGVMARSYADPCGIARALDAVGERWALLVVRELMLGPKRFTDLRAGLPGLSTDILAQRLRELEQAGVAERTTLPPPGAARVYQLTDRGRELEPVLLALGRWGSREPMPPDGRDMTVDAFVLALRTVFDPSEAERVQMTIALRIGSDRFLARVHDGRFEVTRDDPGRPAAADASITADSATLRQVLWHGLPLTDAAVTISGDRRAARRFLRLFPAPRAARAHTSGTRKPAADRR
jgi:DNA-binding HxlR family transcriptional regulator